MSDMSHGYKVDGTAYEVSPVEAGVLIDLAVSARALEDVGGTWRLLPSASLGTDNLGAPGRAIGRRNLTTDINVRPPPFRCHYTVYTSEKIVIMPI